MATQKNTKKENTTKKQIPSQIKKQTTKKSNNQTKTKTSSNTNKNKQTTTSKRKTTSSSVPTKTKKLTPPKEESKYEDFDNAYLKEPEKKKRAKSKQVKQTTTQKTGASKKNVRNSMQQSTRKKEQLTKKKHKLKTKYQNILAIFFFLLFSTIFLFSTYKLFFFKKELNETVEEKETIIEEFVEPPEVYEEVKEEEKIEDMKIDFAKLKQTNKDIVGWMVFNNKYINNPLVQTTDNEYYLNHSFKNKENSVGAIFMDYRNASWEDKNVVLFGHHTPNNTMFGSLSDVFKKEFFDTENADIIYIFDTNHNLRKYQIFSYYVIESEEYYITTSFGSTKDYQEFLKTIKSRSYGNRGVNVTTNDKILTLSTCAGPHGTTRRRVIHAKLIK